MCGGVKEEINQKDGREKEYSHCLSCHYTAGFHYGGTAKHREHLPLTWLTPSSHTHQNICAQSWLPVFCMASIDTLMCVHILLFIPFLLFLFPVTPTPTCLTATSNKNTDFPLLTFLFCNFPCKLVQLQRKSVRLEGRLEVRGLSLSARPPCISITHPNSAFSSVC